MPENPDATILIVYDSEKIRETVSLLATDGEPWRTVELSDPARLLETLEAEKPDVVLLCAMARTTTAYDNCARVKDNQGAIFLPVVVYALRDAPDERQRAYAAGAADIFTIAMPPEEMVLRIRAHLRVRQQVLENHRRTTSLARASAEAADMILQLEEAHRRIKSQNQDLQEKDRQIRKQQHEIQKHLETMQREMEIASRLQVNLMPENFAYDGGLRLFNRYIPAAMLGGDYYDYVATDGGSLFACIADVTGHGAAPALVSVQMRTLARTAVGKAVGPARILGEMNRFMFDTFKRDFLMTYAGLVYDPEARTVAFSGAGHCPLLLLRRQTGDTEELYSRGMPLGVSPQAAYEDDTVEFRPGDRLLMYTDGITEARNADDEEFSPERLIGIFQTCKDMDGEDTLDELLRQVNEFYRGDTFEDDITLVLLEAPA